MLACYLDYSVLQVVTPRMFLAQVMAAAHAPHGTPSCHASMSRCYHMYAAAELTPLLTTFLPSLTSRVAIVITVTSLLELHHLDLIFLAAI